MFYARASNCIDLIRFGGKSPSELDIVDSSETVSQCIYSISWGILNYCLVLFTTSVLQQQLAHVGLINPT